MKTGSLFSGYDGLGLAVDELFPGNTREWFCEWDDAPAKILTHHWPTVPNFRDVTEVDWAAIPPVDILTGGYPCQPFSAAGQRKGTDDERHLWPYVREAIRHLRPRFALLENVAGHRSLGFDRVLGDMAEDGMHVRWTSIRASDIGAPHHRERLFILVTDPRIAHADTEGIGRDHGAATNNWTADRKVDPPRDDRDCASESAGGGPESIDDSALSDAACSQRVRFTDRGIGVPLRGQRESVAVAESVGLVGRGNASEQESRPHAAVDRRGPDIQWGSYAPAIRRWERLTRPAPSPTLPNSNGRPQLNAAFAEWMMGVPAGHVTSVPISRAHQLKAIGNGVCPPQAVAAYSSLLAQAVV